MTFDEWWTAIPEDVRKMMCRTSAEFAWIPARASALREAAEVARYQQEAQFDSYQIYMKHGDVLFAERMDQGRLVAQVIASAIERLGENTCTH